MSEPRCWRGVLSALSSIKIKASNRIHFFLFVCLVSLFFFFLFAILCDRIARMPFTRFRLCFEPQLLFSVFPCCIPCFLRESFAVFFFFGSSFSKMAPLFDSKAVELLRKEGTVAAAEALIGKKYIMLYFSAHWCPPCRSFTPILKDFYARNKERSSFEIIFVSRDNTAEELRSYFDTAHGDWLALSYRDAQTVGEGWAKQYGIYAIPSLVVLENTEQHPIITSYGRDMVLRDPAALQFPWSNADAIMIAARRSFMWKAAAAGVVGMFFLCFLIRWLVCVYYKTPSFFFLRFA